MTEPQVTIHPWSEEALFQKATLYIQLMESTTAEDWQFGFWSALSLELLARAALAHISPTLLADMSNWRNLTYALGCSPTVKRFSPSSVGAKDVLGRLNELLHCSSDRLGDTSNRAPSELPSVQVASIAARDI